ncbi:MAG: peptide ABC transporter substrate-binding protein [Patescibacteria group bacterium]|nr:peptide ABC transporter substrate-binding protein [Patescibacteria group bacterium]MDE1944595.1 peptide ABC transporter substrate-binding protein [Patescibacteria group bacterium]MDE1945214.1 peptide ABC transporter substrate-binding protein [Patescibacteria group bacterium]MDE2058031.1 peptide ABC transporter substrate-binding protein [Patescibacteria group bacterium]
MKESVARAKEVLGKRRAVAPLERLGARVSALPLGDQVILWALGGLLALATALGLLAIERHFLVVVPAYGGTLTEGIVGSPRFVNPLLAITDADRDLAALTYSGLMGEDANGDLVPVLASSYDVSADGKTYTFHLRPSAKFSDGTPVTANDVVFTVTKAEDASLKSPQYADWSGIAVSAPDSATVVFTLGKPYAPFLELTTLGILPAHLWSSISDDQFPFSTLETAPVGAGPFKVTGTTKDANGLITGMTLAANPNYPLGRPYLDGMQIAFEASSDDLARALDSGAIESAYGAAPGAGAGETIVEKPYARVFGIFLNGNANPVYARPEVRKALSLAVDRDALVEEALGGYATPIAGPVPPGAGVAEASVPASATPTADAAAVLEKAGWSYDASSRLWQNAGAKLSLDGITIRTSNVPELRAVADAVEADWEKLGIPVAIELYEPGDLSQNVIRPRKYDALLYGEVIGRDLDLYAFWDSKETADPGLNIALYANKSVDALLEDARANPDSAARLADLAKIETTVAADYPAVFLYAPDFVYTVPADLKGVALPEITTPADRFATVASWYRKTDAVWPLFVPSKH